MGAAARSVLQGPAVSVWRRRRLWALAAGRQLRQLVFLSVQKATLGTGGRGPQARSVLQGPAVSVWRRRRLWAFAAGRQTAQRASFLVGSESNVRHWGWPAGPVRPSGPCWRRRRLWAFAAGRQTAQRASFLVGSESNVRQWGPWPAGPVRPSGPCCFGVAKAPFVSLGGWKTAQS